MNQLLALGVTGFRLYGSNMLGSEDLRAIMANIGAIQPSADALLRVGLPVVLFEPWPYQMVQDATYQPPVNLSLDPLLQAKRGSVLVVVVVLLLLLLLLA